MLSHQTSKGIKLGPVLHAHLFALSVLASYVSYARSDVARGTSPHRDVQDRERVRWTPICGC